MRGGAQQQVAVLFIGKIGAKKM